MDKVLKRFTEILCGTLDNKNQVDTERAEGKQIHPYAKHVTDVCDHKIINRPEGHKGLYILEESYYIYPDKKEVELKPLLFYITSDNDRKAFLQSVQIPDKFALEEVTNINKNLIFDFNDLKISNFGTAEYTLQETDQFTVNHITDMGNGIIFQLTETLSDGYLSVMETVTKNGVKLTPYDTPIEYIKIE